MAITSTRLFDTNPTMVFTAAGQQAITVMYICNTTASNVVVNVNCINSDDSSSSGPDNRIYSELEITANDTYVIDSEKLILDNDDFIEVEADVADAVTVTVSSIAV
jgi:hypothetical protein